MPDDDDDDDAIDRSIVHYATSFNTRALRLPPSSSISRLLSSLLSRLQLL